MDVGEIVYTLMEAIIAISCCLGNMLVIVALWKTKKMQQPTFCLIVSLALADFLVGAVAIPFAVLVDGRVETSFHACLFICCVVILLTLVSVLCLMAIALDRFLRICSPLWYKTTVQKKHSGLLTGACWLVAIPLSFTPMLGWHSSNNKSANSTIHCQFVLVIPIDYLVYFNFVLCTLVPLGVMTVLYGYIFFYIRENLRKKPGNSVETQSQLYLRKEKQLAVSLSLILVLFALSWLPLHIMNCITFFKEPKAVQKVAFYVGIVLSHANSAANPVVYAFRIKKIKMAYLEIWNQVKHCK